uniref:Uncharacterized protein n=1 Tax=viral metagenome TaxID=1070528 RepID=A0A6H1ZL41_9ZZZZ
MTIQEFELSPYGELLSMYLEYIDPKSYQQAKENLEEWYYEQSISSD